MDASEIQEHRKFFLATPLAVYMYVSSRVCLWVYLLSCLFLFYLQCLHSAHLPFLVLSAFFHLLRVFLSLFRSVALTLFQSHLSIGSDRKCRPIQLIANRWRDGLLFFRTSFLSTGSFSLATGGHHVPCDPGGCGRNRSKANTGTAWGGIPQCAHSRDR